MVLDFERRDLQVSFHADVVDEAGSFAVWEIHCLSTRKFHLKHVSRKLQHNLGKCLKNYRNNKKQKHKVKINVMVLLNNKNSNRIQKDVSWQVVRRFDLKTSASSII